LIIGRRNEFFFEKKILKGVFSGPFYIFLVNTQDKVIKQKCILFRIPSTRERKKEESKEKRKFFKMNGTIYIPVY